MKFKVLNNTSSDKLSSVNFATNARKMKAFCVGDKNEKLVKLLRKKQNSTRGSDRFLPKTLHCSYCCGSLHPEEMRVKQSIT